MKALQITQIENDTAKALQGLKIVELEKPKPLPGEVLIRVRAAPCNPSDLLFLTGKYGVSKPLPATPGWEGAGDVVESGGGLLGWWLKGKRVAFAGQSARGGSWAEYTVVKASACVPLSSSITYEQGATLIINPLTAIGMVQRAKERGHKAIVQTAAASQVGRMVVALARQERIPLINIVRKKGQESLLRTSGAEHVLNSEEPHFFSDLKKLSHELDATCAFDAVGGALTGTVLNALPKKSCILVYGALSEMPCSGISPLSLIFEGKKVEGFWLTEWIATEGKLGMMRAVKKAQSLNTEVARVVPLEEAPSALLEYSKNMTGGKIILAPSL